MASRAKVHTAEGNRAAAARRLRRDKAGKAAPDLAYPLNQPTLRRLYSCMLKCRMVEERVCLLYRQGKLAGCYCPALGQEAAEVGATIDLLPEDTVAPSHRNFVTNIVKGMPLNLMFAQLLAPETSLALGRSAPARHPDLFLSLITPVSTIASQLNLGAGMALAYQRQKKPNVVVALFACDSAGLGLWQKAVHFAGAQKLPILYVVENNSWPEPLPSRPHAPVKDFSAKAQACGVPVITVDGSDVVAVYRVTREALRCAREGYGPTLIECQTCCRSGGSGRGTDAAALEPARLAPSRDPIAAMERYLLRQGFWSEEWKSELIAQFNQEIDAAVAFAQSSPDAERLKCLDHVHSFTLGRVSS